VSLFDLLRRPDVTEAQIASLAGLDPAEYADALEQVAILAQYETYIRREASQVEAARRRDHVPIPDGFDYSGCPTYPRKGARSSGGYAPSRSGRRRESPVSRRSTFHVTYLPGRTE
jgi:hypothetical protein